MVRAPLDEAEAAAREGLALGVRGALGEALAQGEGGGEALALALPPPAAPASLVGEAGALALARALALGGALALREGGGEALAQALALAPLALPLEVGPLPTENLSTYIS